MFLIGNKSTRKKQVLIKTKTMKWFLSKIKNAHKETRVTLFFQHFYSPAGVVADMKNSQDSGQMEW